MNNMSFHPAFKRDLKNLPLNVKEKLDQIVDSVATDPDMGQQLHGDLDEVYVYKIKIQKVEYRLAYTKQNQTVVFLMFRKRENFYEYLKRRLLD